MESAVGKTIICNETGREFIGAIEGISTNYARDSQGNFYSNEGVHQREVKDLLDRTRSFTAYLSSDGLRITGWKGNTLMNIVSSSSCKLTRSSFLHSRHSYMSVRAVDVHGKHWYGRGSAGVVITMRPYKDRG
jgi:hypothetical protein